MVFDDAVRDTVLGGADLLAVPTNNATYGYTDMTYQQQGMAASARSSTTGPWSSPPPAARARSSPPTAGVVATTGALFTPGVLVERVPLRTTTTTATRLGALPEGIVAGLGGVALLAAAGTGAARRRRTRGG